MVYCKVETDYTLRFSIFVFQGNYCLESDSLLDTVRQEFDVILAFSVTKWMHLNNGNNGITVSVCLQFVERYVIDL